ncbi:MAG: flagellar basal body P-ring formation chaperone FlgA [Rhodoferax sp.]
MNAHTARTRCLAALASLGLWLAAACLPHLVWAQEQAAEDLRLGAQSWLHEAVQAALPTNQTPLRMEVLVGNLDSRLKLAPCGNVEPYVPTGSRLWGRTRVGMRCVDGMSRWNVSLPVTVNAYGNAWVIRGQVAAGAVVSEADVVESEVNWAAEPSAVLRDRSLWVGQIATRTLSTGQALRQGMVKPAQVFQAGAQVRAVAEGAGFQISADAQALSAGVVGQMARIRMDNGRLATGVVLDTHTVKVEL